MRTDNELTTLLRRGFTHATEDLDPEPDLARAVRRRYVRARRRRLVVGVAVPAVAVAVGFGLALPGRDIPNHTPSQSAAAAPRTPPVTRVPVNHARYKLVALHQRNAPPSCPANATAPVGKSGTPAVAGKSGHPAGAWFFTKKGACVFVGVGGADSKPASATPVDITGYPGVYGTLAGGVRTIYAPSASGGWWVLTMSANAPQDMAVRVIVPAN